MSIDYHREAAQILARFATPRPTDTIISSPRNCLIIIGRPNPGQSERMVSATHRPSSRCGVLP